MWAVCTFHRLIFFLPPRPPSPPRCGIILYLAEAPDCCYVRGSFEKVSVFLTKQQDDLLYARMRVSFLECFLTAENSTTVLQKFVSHYNFFYVMDFCLVSDR